MPRLLGPSAKIHGSFRAKARQDRDGRGGLCPGAMDSPEFSALVIFGHFVTSASTICFVRFLLYGELENPKNSIGGDGEVHSNFGLGLNRSGALIVRLEMPLLDRLLSCGGEDGRAADDLKILD